MLDAKRPRRHAANYAFGVRGYGSRFGKNCIRGEMEINYPIPIAHSPATRRARKHRARSHRQANSH